jgi:thiol-disulfide isomerase/thioredoxin
MNEALMKRALLPLAAAAMFALGAPQAGALEFKPYGRGTFAALREAHAGRPLLVHFWSATCAPCLAELSDWARIAAAKPGADIVFVDVDAENDRARAQGRLEKAGLAREAHYGFAEDGGERLYFEVDPTWRGELPFTAMIDADGKLFTVTGTIDAPLIGAWLAKSTP